MFGQIRSTASEFMFINGCLDRFKLSIILVLYQSCALISTLYNYSTFFPTVIALKNTFGSFQVFPLCYTVSLSIIGILCAAM